MAATLEGTKKLAPIGGTAADGPKTEKAEKDDGRSERTEASIFVDFC